MRTSSPSHKRAVEAFVVEKPYKAVKARHNPLDNKAELNIDVISAKLLSTNSKQNLVFYRYFFIVTFALLIFSLLWNTYLYAHADALKYKVANLSETVDSLADTVLKFNMYGPYSYANIGDIVNPIGNEGKSKEIFIKQIDKEFNYPAELTLTDAQSIVNSGDFPIVVTTVGFPTEVQLQKLLISEEDAEFPNNEDLFHAYYSYSFLYKTYPVTINSGIYPTGGYCDGRDEKYTTIYGELSICSKVSSLTFPDLTDRYDLPMDYRFEIIDSTMEMPTEYFREIVDSIKVVEPA